VDDGVLADLSAAGIKRISAGEPMQHRTSWRIGGPADYFAVAETREDLLAAIGVAKAHDLPWLVLGGGNNILVADEGIEGLVILNRMGSISIDDADSEARLQCEAGVFFAKAALYSAKRGYTGFEWGIAIPGTVGGGVVNNAGAHASDVSAALVSAEVVNPDGGTGTLTIDDLAYHYRESALKVPHSSRSGPVVTRCIFRVETGNAEECMARLEELRQHRLRTQPVKEASAGSTFTNPPGAHAGALIEQAGLKGYRLGGAQVSPLHANFILNVDGASAADVVALIRLIRSRVQEKLDIRLRPEIQLVGRWPGAVVQSLSMEAA